MMGQKQQALLGFFMLLLCLPCLRPLGAVPLPRSLALRSKEAPVVEVADQVITREVRMTAEMLGRRMEIESNDYPGSGANNRHDPKPPGRP